MLCSNRTSSCDFLAERPVESRKVIRIQARLVKRAGVTSQISIHYLSRGRLSSRNMITRSRIAWQSSLASPSASTIAAPSAFCDTFPIAKTPGTRSSNSSTCAEDLGHHATSLRSNTRRGLGAWIASALFRAALITANTGARDATLTWITVLLLHATRGRGRRAPCPASRGARQAS